MLVQTANTNVSHKQAADSTVALYGSMEPSNYDTVNAKILAIHLIWRFGDEQL